MDGATEIGWEPHEIALLNGGPRGAVTVAVVALHLKGALETGPRRTLCATGPEPEGLGPFEGTVLDCLREPLTARELVRHSDVRLAVALARIPLADEGLLRYPRLGPTRGARRRVEFWRARHPLPTVRHGLSDEDTLLAVALHGDAALRMLLPRFALRAGLTAPGAPADRGRFSPVRGRFLRWRDEYEDSVSGDWGAGHGGHSGGCGSGGGGGGD
ncbi:MULTISPECIES: TIGR04222 domain-containing membrane protein [Streptomyces]|uniref:TIGR04222 domain-containing membrane protein n=2 Tax=Streptomyces TaxID=1883 RepID=A0AAX3ZQP1_STRRO|nr:MULTISPECIES: TIGR04222 domain-containing membrane protein [Streptomyces]QCB25276.1 TIGR04222 domain-containing membrane protein [Streptomyces sp. SS52]UAX56599.1 TIGR04222 domain-containing membrane protein [Streptomyces sp. A144]WMC89289.1 TIGR04222 domain-containing membrane protein [Streptomyces rochei]WQC15744.1 TIGR04222 domain-containing membrane protein [Streptomyces rochei]